MKKREKQQIARQVNIGLYKKEKEHKRCTSQENQRSAVNSLNAGKRKYKTRERDKSNPSIKKRLVRKQQT